MRELNRFMGSVDCLITVWDPGGKTNSQSDVFMEFLCKNLTYCVFNDYLGCKEYRGVYGASLLERDRGIVVVGID